ncbi:glycosyltransferase [candidate division WOR-3 bacterium]|nr:glycosyltransferase [candidate division WOR-3 bacterium]
MKIFIDCTSIERGGGVAHYIRNIVNSMPHNIQVIAAMKKRECFENPNIKQIIIPFYNVFSRIVYEHIIFSIIALVNKCKCFFSPKSYTPILRTMPVITTIHDTIPVSDLSGENWYTRLYWKIQLHSAFKLSSGLIFINEMVRDIAFNDYRMGSRRRNCIIYNGFDTYKKNIGKEKYILIPGTLKKRKNNILAVKLGIALKSIFTDKEIIITGRNNNKNIEREIKELSTDINIMGYVNNEKMEYLFNNAFVIIYLSSAEGFSLPIAEACYLNKSVICSDIPIHKYIYNDYPIYYNTDKSIENNITHIKEELIHYEKRECKNQTTWKESSKSTIEFIERISY